MDFSCFIRLVTYHRTIHSSLGDLRGDAVEVPPALAGEPPPAVRRVLLHPLERLQRLQALPRHRAGARAPVRGLGTVVAAHCNEDAQIQVQDLENSIKLASLHGQ